MKEKKKKKEKEGRTKGMRLMLPLFSGGCILGDYWTQYCEAKKDWMGIGSQEDQIAFEDKENIELRACRSPRRKGVRRKRRKRRSKDGRNKELSECFIDRTVEDGHFLRR